MAAAVKDNMALAAGQVAGGCAVQQQAWAGKMAALLSTVGVNVDLTAGPLEPTEYKYIARLKAPVGKSIWLHFVPPLALAWTPIKTL